MTASPIVGVCTLLLLAALMPRDERVIVATSDALYLEDAPGARPVAAIQTRVMCSGSQRQLELTLSPMGNGVVPLPGLDGLPGVNLRTATELDRLYREGAMTLVTRHGGQRALGVLHEVVMDHLPTRTVDDAGNLGRATTPARWPLRVTFCSAPLPEGESYTYLECDEVPRLCVRVTSHEGGAAVEITSLAESAAPVGSR